MTYANGAGPHGAERRADESGANLEVRSRYGRVDITSRLPGSLRPFGGISVDPITPVAWSPRPINTWLAQGEAYGDHFFLSTDGGASWTDVTARGFQLDSNGVTWMDKSQSIHWAGSIEFDPFNGKRVSVTSGNGLFTTEDIDATPCVWKSNVRGLEETVPLNLVSIPNGGPLSVIGDYDGFRSTDISEYAPIHTPRMGTTNGLAYAYAQPNKLVRAGKDLYSPRTPALPGPRLPRPRAARHVSPCPRTVRSYCTRQDARKHLSLDRQRHDLEQVKDWTLKQLWWAMP